MLALLISQQEIHPIVGKEFNTKGQLNYTMMVFFSIPNCSKCEKLQLAMQNVCENLTHVVDCYSINCQDPNNDNLCQKQNVTEYPTLKLYNHNENKKSKVYRGIPTTKNLFNWAAQHHRKPFIQIESNSSARELISGNAHKANILFVFSPNEKPSVLNYKIAKKYKDKLNVVVHVGYSRDAYYRYKGVDLVDYMEKEGLQIIMVKQGKYVKYQGDNNEAEIEKWIGRQI
ncbi:Protein_disulfide isomerase [Hexamita inflata]|uniref:Protein_disulfide isomerase n=1 Tax=Hexamita inflata TaxID=28002 RepID=A0ABP1I9N7_9EUKA